MTLKMGIVQSLIGLEKLIGDHLGASQFLNDEPALFSLTLFDITQLH